MSRVQYAETLDAVLAAFAPFARLSAVVTDDDLASAKRTVERADAAARRDPSREHEPLRARSLERQRDTLALFERTRAELRRLYPGDCALW